MDIKLLFIWFANIFLLSYVLDTVQDVVNTEAPPLLSWSLHESRGRKKTIKQIRDNKKCYKENKQSDRIEMTGGWEESA